MRKGSDSDNAIANACLTLAGLLLVAAGCIAFAIATIWKVWHG